MQYLAQSKRKRAYLLATGQTTSYGSGAGVDDGAYGKGIAKSYTILTTGQYSGTTNITINSKTDAHSNNCVVDNNTGLMWSRTVSASVGPTSAGTLPWTTTGAGATAEGIFPYCAAANAASLAGYTDWRIPNKPEFESIMDYEGANSFPDSTAFPTWVSATYWSSTTQTDTPANAVDPNFAGGQVSTFAKTTAMRTVLVRG